MRMSIGNAIILGLVQGLAEFLPISSSGHLSILNNLFGMTRHPRARRVVRRGMHHRELAGERRARYPAARLFFMICLATIPLLLVMPVKKLMEGLYYNNYFIGAALVLTGCMLFVSDRMTQGKKTVGGMSVWDAIIIGLCQCVATIPGLSRSGTTITAGIATGLRRDFAVKFSFLMSLPAVLGANILGIADAVEEGIDWGSMPAYLIGMAVAMVSGIAAISLLKYIADKGKFGGFAYYCWVVGVLSIILTMIF